MQTLWLVVRIVAVAVWDGIRHPLSDSTICVREDGSIVVIRRPMN